MIPPIHFWIVLGWSASIVAFFYLLIEAQDRARYSGAGRAMLYFLALIMGMVCLEFGFHFLRGLHSSVTDGFYFNRLMIEDTVKEALKK